MVSTLSAAAAASATAAAAAATDKLKITTTAAVVAAIADTFQGSLRLPGDQATTEDPSSRPGRPTAEEGP